MNQTSQREIIGVIPAAGRATRLGPLPCSKELFPVGFQNTDGNAGIRHIHVKSHQSALRTTWATAAWAPAFTEFLHEHLAGLEREAASGLGPRHELYMSHVIMAAIASGLRVEGLELHEARFLDIGVPENLVQALRSQLNSL